jgi:hypothetical protein
MDRLEGWSYYLLRFETAQSEHGVSQFISRGGGENGLTFDTNWVLAILVVISYGLIGELYWELQKVKQYARER